ncbi:CitB family two-component system sensor histidine kinase CitS [Scopulibacillus darangshiensis]|uniref:histidine kinase n=1 Tax=Scopulibacillus darangshiensis TaxID=442528 RepID=A0A4R2NNX5_9BACL|nr:sensor histidine kinase [Scopulibacillus darangshiensis]TCP23483.1 CitB family two-component system sensor histidine kinase CitS [Scopulibacillus darangshiensis]
MKWLKVSLQTKILGLVLSLVLFIIVLLTVIFTYIEAGQIERQKGRLALEVSKTVSFMPSVISAFELDDPAIKIQPIVDKIRRETGAEFIVVGNKDGIRYSHPIPARIGKHMKGGDNYRALKLGEYYTSKAIGSLGPSLRGKSPIYNKKGEIIGIVSVGFLLEDIKHQIVNNVINVTLVAVLVLSFAVFGSVLLARNIRKDTMGLEPYQIASLYKEREAVLQSVKEGILSVDKTGTITMLNQTARKLLNFRGDFHYLKIDDLLPQTHLYEVIKTGKPQVDKELQLENRTVIVNRTPIFDKEGVAGVVASFRDKTEVEQMINTLSEVKRYSEDLRAQTHEFTNKLYVLSGLLQLGEYDQAIEMIQNETTAFEFQNRILFDQIGDAKVQAILLGKLGKASEKKVAFNIDANTTLCSLPAHIRLSHLIIIIGNLLDNAFEAVSKCEHPEVSFFATDIGADIIFEINDNGVGISEEDRHQLFERGFTRKEGKEPRGYGLANTFEAVNELKGLIEVQSEAGEGAVFTVYLPKVLKGGDRANGNH